MRFEFLGRTPAGEEFDRLVRLVREVAGTSLPYATLEDTLRHSAGVPMTEAAAAELAWRVAGNTARLRSRKAVPPWHVQRLPEWVPAQAVGCRRAADKAGNRGAEFAFRVLAGTPAGHTARRWWSLKMARFVAHEAGYTRPRGRLPPRRPYSQPEQLVGLRLYVMIDPAECGQEPGFSKIAVPATFRAWNVETIGCRLRQLRDFACLAGRSAAEPCHTCPVGFTRCRAATHRADWVLKPCPACGADSWFDPEAASGTCVGCSAAAAYRRD